MRTTQISLRSGLTVAAIALPLALSAPVALAGPGITVTVTGTTVQATTTACADGGKAALLSNGAANFAQGRQVTLAGSSASWQNVTPGTHTVVVICQDGTAAGSQTVTVAGAPTTSSTTAPARGVRGGFGGAVEDYGTVTFAAGGALVVAAVGGGAWYLRRRTVRGHL
ncbi:hypothetical protein [Streptomyces spectabilis]|uniref:LPXTG cell wall anchor domain-containing protein n=1 Tax=Streptomyces spectabilis TaxID=68270 RepID=A0A516RIC9_STRST|nr:hypothetical protein [Streptomyces spectabilis]QDQ15409.1 hypothetical protein FH965_36620 [Streptomyces spectabilis]